MSIWDDNNNDTIYDVSDPYFSYYRLEQSPVAFPSGGSKLRSNAIFKCVDLIGEGEIEGLVDGYKSVYLDGVPVQAEDDSYNFENVIVDTRF